MPGMSTLSNLYLDSEPTEVSVRDDQLMVTLADGRRVTIPLELVSQLSQAEPLGRDAQLVILRHPPRIDHVHITTSALTIYLQDGRILSCPLAWFPRLVHGAPAERDHYEVLGDDDVIHWPELDEDIDLLRLLEGGASLESDSSIQRWLRSRHVSATDSLPKIGGHS